MSEERAAYLTSLIGKPWQANAKGPDAYDCYHLAAKVQKDMWGRSLPAVEVPEEPSWAWIIKTLEEHPDRVNWALQEDVLGKVHADGAMVLMAASRLPAHIGVWFRNERSILHVDNPDGVVFQDVPTIKAIGWQRLRFYEPVILND